MLKTKDSFSLQYTTALPFQSFKRMKEIIQQYGNSLFSHFSLILSSGKTPYD